GQGAQAGPRCSVQQLRRHVLVHRGVLRSVGVAPLSGGTGRGPGTALDTTRPAGAAPARACAAGGLRTAAAAVTAVLPAARARVAGLAAGLTARVAAGRTGAAPLSTPVAAGRPGAAPPGPLGPVLLPRTAVTAT